MNIKALSLICTCTIARRHSAQAFSSSSSKSSSESSCSCDSISCTKASEKKAVVVRAFESLIDDPPGSVLKIVSSGELPSVFAPNVRGRVNPPGTFDDLAGTIEYFYGLGGAAAVPGTSVTRVEFPYLVAEGPKEGPLRGGLVMARTDVTFTTAGVDTSLALFGAFRLTEGCQIESYDLQAVNLGASLDPPPVPAARQATIDELCGGIQSLCVGDFQVYDDFADCAGFMSTIDFGTLDRAAENSVMCRTVHVGLAAFRPDIHCPHVSRDGGGVCVEQVYEDYFAFEF